jgi:hypothetical protein
MDFFRLACSEILVQTQDYSLCMVFQTYICYLDAVKQSSVAIVDLTNDQDVSMIVRTCAYHFKAVKQSGDCGSVDYIKIDGWHRHMVASISMTCFHWSILIY